MAQDSVSAIAEDTTGIIATGGNVPPQHPNGHLTKSDWIRIVIWSVPLIFMAATLYVSVTHLSEKSVSHEEHLRKLDSSTGELSADQKVMKEQVSEVCKKADKLMATTEKMDDKLDGQGEDLAAIRAKLNIRERL